MKNKKSSFTIVELIVAMAIFAILMLILMQIFSATQDVWRKTSVKSDTYDSVRQALDMIATDLQSAIFVQEAGGESFYYDKTTLWFPTEKPYKTETSQEPTGEDQKSLEVEVKYETTHYKKDGVNLYQLNYFIQADNSTDWDFKKNPAAHSSFSASSKGVILDNIISFEVKALDKSYNVTNKFPYLVQIEVKVLDDDPQVRIKYKKGDDSLTRTFNRFLFLERGQVY